MTYMKNRNNNSAQVTLDRDRSTPKKPRFIIEVHNDEGDLIAEENVLGWGRKATNFFIFNGVSHVRYLGTDTHEAINNLR